MFGFVLRVYYVATGRGAERGEWVVTKYPLRKPVNPNYTPNVGRMTPEHMNCINMTLGLPHYTQSCPPNLIIGGILLYCVSSVRFLWLFGFKRAFSYIIFLRNFSKF